MSDIPLHNNRATQQTSGMPRISKIVASSGNPIHNNIATSSYTTEKRPIALVAGAYERNRAASRYTAKAASRYIIMSDTHNRCNHFCVRVDKHEECLPNLNDT